MNKKFVLLLIPCCFGLLAMSTGMMFYKVAVPLSCASILLISFRHHRAKSGLYLIVAAFAFSVLGDFFLSNKTGRDFFFVYGIAAYFFAHVGYCLYAKSKGRLHKTDLITLLLIFLAYYIWGLHPAIDDTLLKSAVFIYLLISVLALALAFGLEQPGLPKVLFVAGIVLIVISDTIISFTEFLNFGSLNFMILPTYYLAHVSITASLIQQAH